MAAPEWDCDAYGAGAAAAGALCFFADQGTRNCGDHAECAASVAAARQLLFDRIRAGAAAGDPDMVYLAGEFTSPAQLLAGGGP